MLHITLLTVGKIKVPWLAEGCAEYLSRLEHDFTINVVEIPASKEKDPAKQSQEESEKILKRLEKIDGKIWVLDERGKGMTSLEFASGVSSIKDSGVPLTFVIGGAYGLTDAVRSRGDRLVSVSAMTLPHELCRLVFLEQLYRATQIQRKSGYHH